MKNMIRGWFIGDFTPTAFSTDSCEVAFKKYKAGDYEEKHLHKIGTEITMVINGKVTMNGVEYKEGDIILIESGEATDFKALTDVRTIVVKVPGAKEDKYLV